jgi:hypothetical protein
LGAAAEDEDDRARSRPLARSTEAIWERRPVAGGQVATVVGRGEAVECWAVGGPSNLAHPVFLNRKRDEYVFIPSEKWNPENPKGYASRTR